VPQKVGTISDRALLQSGLVCLLGFLVLALAVVQHRFDDADHGARTLVQETRLPALVGLMTSASYFGGQPGQVAVVVASVAVLWTRRRRWAVGLPVAMAGIGAVQLAAKWAMDRPRPNLDPWGFPSAHVMSLVVLGGYLLYVVSLAAARSRTRAALGAYVAVVATVAYSRMYLEAHFLSDVLGGMTLGLAYLALALWVITSSPRLARRLRAVPLAATPGARLVPVAATPGVEALVAVPAGAPLAPAAPVAEPR
jgi:membrane-associated phospholipid phosphatase